MRESLSSCPAYTDKDHVLCSDHRSGLVWGVIDLLDELQIVEQR